MYYIIEIGNTYNARQKWSGRNYTLRCAETLLNDILINREYYSYYICKYSISDYLHDYGKQMSSLKTNMLLSFEEFWEPLY